MALLDLSARDALAAQIRAQYGGSGAGSGNWDDAGHDRAGELADLLMKQGVTSLGELSYVDTPWSKDHDAIEASYGEGAQDGRAAFTETGVNRQLKIGDKTVGFLGDYNNDGTFGNKSAEYLQTHNLGSDREENLLGWSARGDGNTSYRVITDPATGKLVISPGWNSSSDAANARNAALVMGSVLGGGYALAGMGAAGAGGAAAGTGATAGTTAATAGANWGALGTAAAKSAAINAGMTLAQGGGLKDALKAGAIGGVTGGIGGYGASMGYSPFLTGAAASGAGAALRGADGKDILTSAALGGLTAGGNKYMRDMGLSPEVRGAVTGGGRALLTGGGGSDILRGAVTGGVSSLGKTDPARASATNQGSNTMSYNDTDWGETIDYSQFGAPATGYDPWVADGYQYQPTAVDPYGAGSGWGGDTLPAMGAPDDTAPGIGDYANGVFGVVSNLFKGGGSAGGGAAGAAGRGVLSFMGLDFTGGDLLKLLAGGLAGNQDQKWRDQDRAQRESEFSRSRQWQVEDRNAAEALADRKLAEKFERMRPAKGLLQPQLTRIGG